MADPSSTIHASAKRRTEKAVEHAVSSLRQTRSSQGTARPSAANRLTDAKRASADRRGVSASTRTVRSAESRCPNEIKRSAIACARPVRTSATESGLQHVFSITPTARKKPDVEPQTSHQMPEDRRSDF